MADRKIRELARTAQADPEAQVHLLRERMRTGEVSEGRVRAFAALGHLPAARLLGIDASPNGRVAAGLDLLDADARLARLEAAVWCSERLESVTKESKTGEVLRPPELEPSRHPWADEDPASLVAEVISARRGRLGEAGGWIDHVDLETLPGRLLGYDEGLSLFDGATNAGSDGFFDDYDCPPWATWVAYVDTTLQVDGEKWGGPFLLAWVPPVLVDLVADWRTFEAGWSLDENR